MTDSLLPRDHAEIAPGAHHLPDWLPMERQQALVEACREWSRPPAGMHATRVPGGGVMSARTVCLGWHWLPYRYTRVAEDVDGTPVKPFPVWLGEIAREAVAATGSATVDYEPDVALVNYYDADARMGMHRDKEEVCGAPVVSFSIGDDCVFRFGNTADRGRPYTDVTLRSGDLFVFGGPSRFAFHGVTRILPGTGEPATGLRAGRLNLTIRQTGLP